MCATLPSARFNRSYPERSRSQRSPRMTPSVVVKLVVCCGIVRTGLLDGAFAGKLHFPWRRDGCIPSLEKEAMRTSLLANLLLAGVLALTLSGSAASAPDKEGGTFRVELCSTDNANCFDRLDPALAQGFGSG